MLPSSSPLYTRGCERKKPTSNLLSHLTCPRFDVARPFLLLAFALSEARAISRTSSPCHEWKYPEENITSKYSNPTSKEPFNPTTWHYIDQVIWPVISLTLFKIIAQDLLKISASVWNLWPPKKMGVYWEGALPIEPRRKDTLRTVVEGLNVINDPKCNKVLNVIKFCPKCNNILF